MAQVRSQAREATTGRKRDWFTPSIFLAVALAWLHPALGARGGPLHPEIVVKAGVALVFLLMGLNLPMAALRRSALNWRLHLLVQLTTFVIFPLVGLGLASGLAGRLPPEACLGLVFLGALPSTVSSSVVLTAAAGGNVAAAVFNATLSNVLGIVLTPLWLGWYLQGAGEIGTLAPLVLQLGWWMLLPLVMGQVARRWLAGWAERHRRPMRLMDRLVILLLIYTSMCDSFRSGLWEGRDWRWFILLVVIPGLVLGTSMYLLAVVTRWLRWAGPDRTAAIFCGSQKSLVSGAAMANLLFAGAPGLGLVLAPVMVYHAIQLLLSGVLAGRWRERPLR